MGRLVLIVLALLVLAVGTVCGILMYAVAEQDRVAAAQSQRTVQVALDQSLLRLGATVSDYANWDEAVAQLAGPRDPDWLARTLGQPLTQNFDISAVLLVEDGGRVLTLGQGPGQDSVVLAPEAADSAIPVGLAAAARAVPAGKRGLATGVVVRDGSANLAAAADLRDETTASRPPNGAVLVFLQRLEGERLAALQHAVGVADLAFVPAGADSETPEGQVGRVGRVGLTLRDPGGRAVGSLSWEAPAPARDFIGRAVWLVLPVLAGMFGLTGLVLTHAQRFAVERVGMAAAVVESEARQRLLLENVPDLVGLVRHGRIELLNLSGAWLLGLPDATAAQGRRFVDLVAPEDRIRVALLLADPESPARWEEVQLLGEHGDPIPTRLLILDMTREGAGTVMVVARDRSEQEEANRSLRQALDQARVADVAKGRFLANVSHELRSPLNAIIGFSRILGDAPTLDPGLAGYVGDIRDAGGYLLRLVDDLLDLARMDSGQFDLREGWIDIPILAGRCRREVEPALAEAGMTLLLETETIGDRLLADEPRLKQAIGKLVETAIRSGHRGDTVRLSFSRAADGDLIVRISDQGVGMTAEDIARAIEPFGQDEHDRRAGVAAGLALPLAKGIAEAHGGSLTLSSTPGVGTTALLRLPRSRLYAPDFARA